MPESTKRVEYEGDKSTVRAIANEVKNFVQSLGLSDVTRRRNTVISDRARIEVSRQRDKPIVTITAEREETAQQIADFAGGRTVGSTEPEEVEASAQITEEPAEDGMFGQVFKPFDHDEAGYVDPGHEDFDRSHPRCEDCAHYDGEGNCHIVPNIQAQGYCDEYYADVGFFATGVTSLPDPAGEKQLPHVNLTLWGEKLKRVEGSSAGAIVESIKDEFEKKLGDFVQFIND